MTLVADILQISSPIHTEDERKSISGDSYTSSGNSSSGDLNDATIVAQPKQRTPRGERNLLPCEVCGKAFDRPSLLKRHMRTHTGKSKFLNVSAIPRCFCCIYTCTRDFYAHAKKFNFVTMNYWSWITYKIIYQLSLGHINGSVWPKKIF